MRLFPDVGSRAYALFTIGYSMVGSHGIDSGNGFVEHGGDIFHHHYLRQWFGVCRGSEPFKHFMFFLSDDYLAGCRIFFLNILFLIKEANLTGNLYFCHIFYLSALPDKFCS